MFNGNKRSQSSGGESIAKRTKMGDNNHDNSIFARKSLAFIEHWETFLYIHPTGFYCHPNSLSITIHIERQTQIHNCE